MKMDREEKIYLAMVVAGLVVFFALMLMMLHYSSKKDVEPHIRIFYEGGHSDRPIVTVEVGDRIIRLKQEGEP